jgi:uncharacterized protein with PIN domain
VAVVHNYPAEDDLKVIKCCVNLFLKSRNAKARDMMAKSIRFILNKYGITRLELDDYQVRASGEKYAVVEAREWLWNERSCPKCEEPLYRLDSRVAILSVRENQPEGWDEVSYGCKCGRVFRKLERNE